MSGPSLIENKDVELFNTPEKWYIRRRWLEYARNRKNINGKDFINFLTLTSIPIYDIRLFEDNGLIATTDSGYSKDTLAVCEENSQRYSLIRNRIPGAKTFGGRIQELLRTDAAGYNRRVEHWFPFDVFNIDLYGAPFSRGQFLREIFQKIFSLQKNMESSFTLFLTLSCTEGEDEGAIKYVKELLLSNVSDEEFDSIFQEKYPEFEKIDLVDFLKLVIPKLLIHIGGQEGFDVINQETYTYVGTGNMTKMIVFIIDCNLISGFDALSILATLRPSRVLEVIKFNHTDVNELLTDNDHIRAECDQDCEEYLKPPKYGVL